MKKSKLLKGYDNIYNDTYCTEKKTKIDQALFLKV